MGLRLADDWYTVKRCLKLTGCVSVLGETEDNAIEVWTSGPGDGRKGPGNLKRILAANPGPAWSSLVQVGPGCLCGGKGIVLFVYFLIVILFGFTWLCFVETESHLLLELPSNVWFGSSARTFWWLELQGCTWLVNWNSLRREKKEKILPHRPHQNHQHSQAPLLHAFCMPSAVRHTVPMDLFNFANSKEIFALLHRIKE